MGADTIIARPKGAAVTANWVPPELTVIVPSFKERDNIAPLYDKLATALAGIAWEMIVVDDNSPDGTADVARELARRHPNARCHPPHRPPRPELGGDRGHGRQRRDLCRGDRRRPPARRAHPAPDAGERWRDHEIVVGSRYAGGGQRRATGSPRPARRAASFATQLSRLLTGASLSDPMSGFFLMRREIFDRDRPDAQQRGLQDPARHHRLGDRASAPAAASRSASARCPTPSAPRHAGESKMSSLIVVQFLGLLMSKLSRGLAARRASCCSRSSAPAASSSTSRRSGWRTSAWASTSPTASSPRRSSR